MKLFRNLAMLAILPVIMVSNAYAAAHTEENIKMHCVFLKGGKVIKQQNCVADGYVHAGAGYGGGSGYNFKSIKGYGEISVDVSSELVKDARGELVYNSDGSNKTIDSQTLNGKDAIVRYRKLKTFKLLTANEEKRYYNGNLGAYTCFIHKNKPTYEFCFSGGLMG